MSQEYLKNVFALEKKNYKIIPIHWNPTNYYEVLFNGWSFSVNYNDENFRNILDISSKTMKRIIFIYKKTHAFTQPYISIKPDGSFAIKIGTMENEMYEKLMKKYPEDYK